MLRTSCIIRNGGKFTNLKKIQVLSNAEMLFFIKVHFFQDEKSSYDLFLNQKLEDFQSIMSSGKLSKALKDIFEGAQSNMNHVN